MNPHRPDLTGIGTRTIVLREGKAGFVGREIVFGWSTRFAGAISTVFDIGYKELVRHKKSNSFRILQIPGRQLPLVSFQIFTDRIGVKAEN